MTYTDPNTGLSIVYYLNLQEELYFNYLQWWRGRSILAVHTKYVQKNLSIKQGIKKKTSKKVIIMPLLTYLSIAQSVEHSAVNRVVAGKVQPGEPKEYSLSKVGVDDAGGPPRVLADSAH